MVLGSVYVLCVYYSCWQGEESSIVFFSHAGAQFLACGPVASSVCVCAAMKKKIMVFEITKLKARYTKLKVH